jgi:predicted Zn-dependent peptidase
MLHLFQCIVLLCAVQGFFVQELNAQTSKKTKKNDAVKTVEAAPSLMPEMFMLKNGLQVLLFEDPTARDLTLRLQIAGGTAADLQDKEGTAALLADWLNFNATSSISDVVPPLDTTITKFHAVAEPDAISITLRGAPNRFPTLITLLVEAASAPVFLRSDMETLREGLLQRVLSAQTSVEYLIDAMSARVLLGDYHPYARRAGETSLSALTINEVKDFHALFFLPNNASLAVIGGMSKKELQPLLEKAFKNWKQGVVPRFPDLTPRPLPQGIYLVEAPKARYIREGRVIAGAYTPVDSTQKTDSTARNFPTTVFASLGAPIGAFDEEAMLQALESPEIQHLPNKFATRLIPRYIASSAGFEKIIGRIGKGENPVQDHVPADSSAFALRRASDEKRVRRMLDSTYVRAVWLQNGLLNNIKPDYILATLERVKSTSLNDVQDAASKYLGSARLTMIVVGSPESVNPLVGLGVAQSRVVYRYSEALEPILTFEKSEFSLQEIISKHAQALGGTSAIATLHSLIATSELQLSAMGQKFPGTIVTKQKAPNKISRILEIPATQMLQALWCDGSKAFDKIEMMGNEQPLQQRQSKETESALFDAQIFPLLSLQSCGYTGELLGKREGQFVIKASAAGGTVKTLSLDETTFLLTKIEEMRQTPQGIIRSVQEFRDYERVGGIQLPSVIVLRTGPGTLIGKNKYQLNADISDAEFLPK